MASPGLTGEQAYTLLLIERVTSVFSLVGCAFIFATFVFSKKFRRPVNRLIFFASLGNISMGVATVMSTTPVFDPDGALCQFQAFLIQMYAYTPTSPITELQTRDQSADPHLQVPSRRCAMESLDGYQRLSDHLPPLGCAETQKA